MRNKTMEKKQAQGFLVDVSVYPRIAGFYLIPWDAQVREWEGGRVDFADTTTEEWIWSIGRALKTIKIKPFRIKPTVEDNIAYLVQEGQVLASTSGILYQNARFDCLWLR